MTQTWIGLTDRTTALFHRDGLESPVAPRSAFAPADLLSRGCLMLETGIPAHDRPQMLLSYHHLHPWERGLALHALPDGAVVLVVTQGSTVSHTVLHHGLTGQGHRLRITYNWDAPARHGTLTVTAIGTMQHLLETVRTPVPLGLGDLQALFLHPTAHDIDPEVTFVALADAPQPVGPMPTLAPEVPVLTATGYRPIHTLKRGDLVRTPTGDQVPVLANLRATLPARGSLRQIRLRAPYFGLQRDISVAPCQCLCASGSDVEFLFGAPTVLIPAQHMVNGVSAWYSDGPVTTTWHQLVLPRAEPILAAGEPLQSLYLGRMRRRPDLIAASLLARYDRSRLPEHARPPFPVLRAYEAVTLVQHRAA